MSEVLPEFGLVERDFEERFLGVVDRIQLLDHPREQLASRAADEILVGHEIRVRLVHDRHDECPVSLSESILAQLLGSADLDQIAVDGDVKRDDPIVEFEQSDRDGLGLGHVSEGDFEDGHVDQFVVVGVVFHTPIIPDRDLRVKLIAPILGIPLS